MSTTKYCGCLGCTEEAVAVIDRNGDRRTVCETHINGYEVMERV